jgi:hypothetical protein
MTRDATSSTAKRLMLALIYLIFQLSSLCVSTEYPFTFETCILPVDNMNPLQTRLLL